MSWLLFIRFLLYKVGLTVFADLGCVDIDFWHYGQNGLWSRARLCNITSEITVTQVQVLAILY